MFDPGSVFLNARIMCHAKSWDIALADPSKLFFEVKNQAHLLQVTDICSLILLFSLANTLYVED